MAIARICEVGVTASRNSGHDIMQLKRYDKLKSFSRALFFVERKKCRFPDNN
jgi:hypothetical protein